jgi:uncharacterized protein YcbX
MKKLVELNIYPVKSCQGQAVKQMTITSEGPEGDRQWMLVDEKGEFLTQRKHPKMATIQVLLNEQGLSLGLGKQFFVVPKNNSMKRQVGATIWGHALDVALEPDLFSQAISHYLSIPCRLVRYAPYSKRMLPSSDPNWKPEVRFADGRPLLLLNTKSLEELNGRLAKPVGIDRFRGNIVFEGEQAFEEDSWTRIKIGEVIFSQPKKAARCNVITIDQKTGLSESAEPLKTLATYRREGNRVNFGVLWIPENPGVIDAGAEVEVLN